jgi:hypothetical protein
MQSNKKMLYLKPDGGLSSKICAFLNANKRVIIERNAKRYIIT